jgi:mRNA-degrading endonuclease RelE of RelBE toxin-antitoxin system
MLIDLLPGAVQDIDSLCQSDPDALGTILPFLEEASADPALIDKFTTPGDVVFPHFHTNVKRWAGARRTCNFFRIRVLDSPATSYRVVYGYNWHERRIGVLAIVHKDYFDYGLQSELAQRIFDDWHTATEGKFT